MNLVHTWTVGRCIVYTGIRLLPIRPFMFSFFFRSNFQTLKFVVTFFSGAVRPRRLNLIHAWTVSRCIVYTGIRLLLLLLLLLSHPFFIFFSLQFSKIKNFRNIFLRNLKPRRLKLGTHVDSGQMYRVYRNQTAATYSSLCFFIFLSLQFSNIKNFRHTFLRNCQAWKVDS